MKTPKELGYTMPAEYEKHSATIMIWPERAGSWIYGAKYARPVFAGIIKAIAEGETVYLAVSENSGASARELLKNEIDCGIVRLVCINTNDCWARDISPVFLKKDNGLLAADFAFNAWGGDFNGLYKDYGSDDKFAENLCKELNFSVYSARPFVLEGGSVHSNGKGTIITTEECLLSKGRNPKLSKEEIELNLKEIFGAERVIWLPYGVENDETDGHIDNICAFVSQNSVLLAWSGEGEQGRRCRENYQVLRDSGLTVIKVPFPETPVTITRFDAEGLTAEEGEDMREVGEKLAASYVNFYVCNSAVLVPQFGDKNDKAALEIIGGCFKDRKVIPVAARHLITGGGNIHCLTMQIPEKF